MNNHGYTKLLLRKTPSPLNSLPSQASATTRQNYQHWANSDRWTRGKRGQQANRSISQIQDCNWASPQRMVNFSAKVSIGPCGGVNSSPLSLSQASSWGRKQEPGSYSLAATLNIFLPKQDFPWSHTRGCWRGWKKESKKCNSLVKRDWLPGGGRRGGGNGEWKTVNFNPMENSSSPGILLWIFPASREPPVALLVQSVRARWRQVLLRKGSQDDKTARLSNQWSVAADRPGGAYTHAAMGAVWLLMLLLWVEGRSSMRGFPIPHGWAAKWFYSLMPG